MKFFIVGTGRCGTSFLQRLLDAHPDVFVLNESHALPLLFERYGLSAAPTHELAQMVIDTRFVSGECIIMKNALRAGYTQDEFLTLINELIREHPHLTVVAFWQRVMDALRKKARKTVVADKTPDYGAYMGLLQCLWPDAQFVHLVRNGWATAQSMVKHPGYRELVRRNRDNWCTLAHGAWQPTQHPVKEPELTDCLQLWARRLRKIQSESTQLAEANYLEFRYEDLLRQPAALMEAMAKGLGLSASPEWLEHCVSQVDTGALTRLEALQYSEQSLVTSNPASLELMRHYGYLESVTG